MSETGGTFPEPAGTVNPILPIPDRVEPVNFPYRGGEQHGVAVEGRPWIPQDADEQSWEGLEAYDPNTEPLQPVPVVVVNHGAREQRAWRALRHTAGRNPTQCIGQDLGRSRVRIRNLSTDTIVYIADNTMCTHYTGYPIPFGTELAIDAETEVWCVVGPVANDVELAILSEHAIA